MPEASALRIDIDLLIDIFNFDSLFFYYFLLFGQAPWPPASLSVAASSFLSVGKMMMMMSQLNLIVLNLNNRAGQNNNHHPILSVKPISIIPDRLIKRENAIDPFH